MLLVDPIRVPEIQKKSAGNSVVVFFCGGFWVVRKTFKKHRGRKCVETSIYC